MILDFFEEFGDPSSLFHLLSLQAPDLQAVKQPHSIILPPL